MSFQTDAFGSTYDWLVSPLADMFTIFTVSKVYTVCFTAIYYDINDISH